MDELQDLINETKRNEQYWERVVELLGTHKDALDKHGDDVYDRLKDLLDMGVQQYHIYNALITELNILRHGN
tara:strand:- start:102 stop:317 length:216 start_codon:yes stop_codon:yes gene_type:complete